MSESTNCRLCFAAENAQNLNIFGDIGNELRISEIIGEHFKCDISESDHLPNYICTVCWTTTEAFHELYQKSKAIQDKFVQPIVKIEIDSTGIYQGNYDHDSAQDEQSVDISRIKVEPVLDVQNSFETEMFIESKDQLFTDSEVILRDEPMEVIDTTISKLRPRQNSNRRLAAKQKNEDFQKLFAENKHRFDMTCDNCSSIFESFEEARKHYASEHNNSKGYIKCCNVKLTYRCDIVSHLYRHVDPDKFKCTECGKTYCAPHILKAHMKQHTEKPEKKCLICDICQKTFTSKSGLKRHFKWHKSEGAKNTDTDEDHKRFIAENFDMSCDHCDAIFISFHDARNHYKESHNDKKGYIKCCNIKLKELWIVTDHINSHLNPANFKCDLCNKNFPSGMRLNQHKGRHRRAIERPFVCDMCGKSFRDKETITRHMFTTHVDSEPKFECDICHKRFQLANLLKNHVYSVHREKKAIVTCEICGKSFKVKSHFDKHLLSHTDKSERLAQRKQCEHCGDWLMTKSGIYYHEQIHTSGVQKCDQCPMELPNKIALLAHIRKYHRVRTHKCSYCDKSFPVSSELKKHEEGHTRHNVYPCQFCSKEFTLRTSRLTHQKRSHREELKQMREMRSLMKHSAT